MRQMRKMKAQVWSYDLTIAVVAFILSLAFIIFFWWDVSVTTSAPRGDMLIDEARSLADIITSPGNPSDWNSTVDTAAPATWDYIGALGMGDAFGSPEISGDKAAKLVEMNASNYSALKAKLRTNYNFYIEMKEFYNCTVSTFCSEKGIMPGDPEYSENEHYASPDGVNNFTIGQPPDSGYARSIAAVNRFAVLNHSLVRIKVIVWTNRTWQ